MISNRNEITFCQQKSSVLGKFRSGRGRAEHVWRQRVHWLQRVSRFLGVSAFEINETISDGN